MKKFLYVILLLVFVLIAGVSSAQTQAEGIKVALVVTPPGKSDLGWNFVHWLGCERAKDSGLVQEYAEVVSTETTVLSDLTLLAQSKEYDLIIVCGWEFLDALQVVANNFPDQNFIMTDVVAEFGEDEPGKFNTLSILFQQEQPSALVGALAALLAVHYDYPHVGIVLGVEGPVLYEFEMGYKWGVNWAVNWVKEHHPDLAAQSKFINTPEKERVLWTYTGTWSDPAKGREATEIQIRQGAVAVYAVAGSTGLGVLSYIDDHHKEQNIPFTDPPFAIGVDIAQDWMNPYIVASAMKRADVAVVEAVKLIQAGTFKERIAEDNILWMNFANQGTWMSDEQTLDEFMQYMVRLGSLKAEERTKILEQWKELRAAQPSWVWEAIDELREAIINGTVDIPRPFGDPERWPIEELRAEYG
ncbi:MAG TPA: BMP family ABC transporter substrate-binding protein [Candidatus Atribacteria bacterium]|nr:BMP family ABC transporter substrate-binding protein [Candidatus Atribacteria bacterium]